MLSQIRNVDELDSTAIAALEIMKRFAGAKHHLAGDVLTVILLVPADLAIIMHISLISKSKKC